MAIGTEVEAALRAKFDSLLPHLDERQRRLTLGAEARVLGHGGIKLVARAAGASPTTVSRGVAELEAGNGPSAQVRQPGAGRKAQTVTDPGLTDALLGLVEPEERGDPMSPLRWTTKSTSALAAELTSTGHPVISVDTKKKELVGLYKNGGQQWRPAGDPVRVNVHDFADPELGKANPYGVYDVTANDGWVSVGTDHDTAAFAVETIRRWFDQVGHNAYPGADRLLVCADGGGSNGYRLRAWKTGLAALAQETGLNITVCHLPPGSSKWNKIEHRLFSHISMNWRGRPLTSHQVIVDLIGGTTTRTGLKAHAGLDNATYPTGIKISLSL